MSGNETGSEPVEHKTTAFEYVAGTLSAEEMREAQQRLQSDPEFQKDVLFWENQLMNIQPEDERAPSPDTWNKISEAIQPKSKNQNAALQEGSAGWKTFLQWGSPTIAAFLLMIVLFGYYPKMNPPTPITSNVDYVAVLVNHNNRAVLTALTAANNQTMQLKWEGIQQNPDSHLQLWATSKRDGETRPIAVFSDTHTNTLSLNTSQWRLVTDADYLLLTEEEPGGSAIDEPSEILLAKGVCIRFSPDKKTI